MALVALGTKGSFLHVYDFRVKQGKGGDFIKKFDEFACSDSNPMHRSKAQTKDGVLYRDINDPDHFYLLGEGNDIKAHADILEQILAMRPEFVALVESGPTKLKPVYAEVVSSTAQHLLDKASTAPESNYWSKYVGVGFPRAF